MSFEGKTPIGTAAPTFKPVRPGRPAGTVQADHPLRVALEVNRQSRDRLALRETARPESTPFTVVAAFEAERSRAITEAGLPRDKTNLARHDLAYEMETRRRQLAAPDHLRPGDMSLEARGERHALRAETLYEIADDMTRFAHEGDNRHFSKVQARHFQDRAIAEDVRATVALHGLDAVMTRSGLDAEKARDLIDRSGASDLLAERDARADVKSPEDHRADWARDQAGPDKAAFATRVQQTRARAIETLWPEASEDLATRTRRATMVTLARKADEQGFASRNSALLTDRLARGLPEGSPERAEMAGLKMFISATRDLDALHGSPRNEGR